MKTPRVYDLRTGRQCLRSGWVPAVDLRLALQKLPRRIEEQAEARYRQQAGYPAEGSENDPLEAAAAQALARTIACFEAMPPGLDAKSSDRDICELADKEAAAFQRRRASGWPLPMLLAEAQALGLDSERTFAAQLKVWRDLFTTEEEKAAAFKGIAGRLAEGRFWRRQLRRLHRRAREMGMREVGMVSRRHGLYVSNETVRAHREQRRRNAELLALMQAENDLGERFQLSEVVAGSMANPKIRRMELMARLVGFDEIARTCRHHGVMVTLTCPSRFHRKLHTGRDNPKYDGSSVPDALDYLQTVWTQIRAALRRAGIGVYGLRVAEPHHDGTPHWHMLVFMEEQHRLDFRRIVARYGCRENREELGLRYYQTATERDEAARARQQMIQAATGEKKSLQSIKAGMKTESDFWAQHSFKGWKAGKPRRRVDFETIDRSKGSAVAYVAKYICKNLDGKTNSGESVEDYEAYEKQLAEYTAERVMAWASTFGCRQFQQIGGVPVTLYRELRREHQEVEDGVLHQAAQAADKGDWGRFVMLLGGSEGPFAARKDLPLALYNEDAPISNQYGEPKKNLRGVVDVHTGEYVITRIREWTISRQGGADAPWTCVNNCTNSESAPNRVYSEAEITAIIRTCEPVSKHEPVPEWALSPQQVAEQLAAAHEGLKAQVEESEWQQYLQALRKLRRQSAWLTRPSGLVPPEPQGDPQAGRTRLSRYLPLPQRGQTVAQQWAQQRERLASISEWLADDEFEFI